MCEPSVLTNTTQSAYAFTRASTGYIDNAIMAFHCGEGNGFKTIRYLID